MLLKSYSKDCGLPTCMVFAARMAEGIENAEDCPPLGADNKKQLEE